MNATATKSDNGRHTQALFAATPPPTNSMPPPPEPADLDGPTEEDIAAASRAGADIRKRIAAKARRTYLITTASYEQGAESRVGLSPDTVVGKFVRELRDALAADIARGTPPAVAAAREEDRAVWEGTRIVAVVRPGADGEPVVTTF